MLKKLFGLHLGTGDYGHLVIDHSAICSYGTLGPSINILAKDLRPLISYTLRQLYSKATSHNASGPGQSCELQDTVLFSSSLSSLSLLF